jgi:copper chaperone CopZ
VFKNTQTIPILERKIKKRFKRRNNFVKSPLLKTAVSALFHLKSHFLNAARLFPFLITTLVLINPLPIKAQFISATLGINGLTCSLCSYSVEREIEKLDFVDHVTMDLNQNIVAIVFKPNQAVRMKEVVDAVYKAGFSVGYTQALFSFQTISIGEDFSFQYEGDRYELLDENIQDLKGEQVIRFIDKKYTLPKNYKVWESKIKSNTQKMPKPRIFVYHIIR